MGASANLLDSFFQPVPPAADYGNAELDNRDDGKATMEVRGPGDSELALLPIHTRACCLQAVYFGNATQWGHGSGAGPWVMADLEQGLWRAWGRELARSAAQGPHCPPLLLRLPQPARPR